MMGMSKGSSRGHVTRGSVRRGAPALAVSCLVAVGCQVEAHDPPPGRSALAEAITAAHQRMHVRFTAATRIEQAIAHGDLDRAHSEARTLASLEEPEALPNWRPYFASIRDAAQQLAASTSVITAARLTATLGRRCGSCHEAIAARIPFPAEPAPPRDPHLAIQMVGHQWAAAQMWQGVIGPAPDRWLAGARALTTAPLNIVAQSVTPTSPDDIDDVARIRLLANRAVAPGSQDDRAELFGTMLATCAHCHAMLRDR
jgi:cytochrome c553